MNWPRASLYDVSWFKKCGFQFIFSIKIDNLEIVHRHREGGWTTPSLFYCCDRWWQWESFHSSGEGRRGRAQQSKKFLAPLSEIVGKLSSSRLLSLSSPLSPKAERQQTIPQLVAPAVLPFSRGGLFCVELSVLLISDSWSLVHPMSCCWYDFWYTVDQLSKMCETEGLFLRVSDFIFTFGKQPQQVYMF